MLKSLTEHRMTRDLLTKLDIFFIDIRIWIRIWVNGGGDERERGPEKKKESPELTH